MTFHPSVFFCMVATFAITASAQLNNAVMPMLADDLKSGELWYTRKHAVGNQQGHGYDLHVRRKSGNSWTSLKPGKSGSKNSDTLAYGKPVYAIASGKVVACWRNAPDNPNPPNKHPLNGYRIPGGGNSIWVEMSDNSKYLIAHLQPGTIPTSLCPNNGIFFDIDSAGQPIPGQTTVSPPIPITKGAYIGRTGNSGNSDGVHIHVHAINSAGLAMPINFQKGLATAYNSGNANIHEWAKVGHGPIPLSIDSQKEVLVWPPRKIVSEYSRHGFRDSEFKSMFTHLTDSGFSPRWMDIYRVGRILYRNFVFEPKTHTFLSYSKMTKSLHQTRFDNAVQVGYKPVHLEAYNAGSGARYAVVYKKGISGRWDLRTDRPFSDYYALKQTNEKNGLTMTNLAVVPVKNQLRYSALYREIDIGKTRVYTAILDSSYQTIFNSNWNAKPRRFPYAINAYKHDGRRYYAVIFAEKPNVLKRAKHGLTSSEYKAQFVQNVVLDKFATRAVTAMDGDTTHIFAGEWNKL